MTPIDALYHQATHHPRQTAFIAGDEVWTYHRLAHEAERLAQALIARGLRPGDRVALHMVNRPELVVAYYACFRIGVIAAPLNARFKTAELRPLLQRLRPSLYLGEAQLYRQITPIEPAIVGSGARFIADGAAEDDRAQPWADLIDCAGGTSTLPDPDDSAPAVLLGTSGTTGLAKFVIHTPATLSAKTDSCMRMGFETPQTTVNAVPMMHGSGLMTMLASMRYGAPMVLFERFDADAVLDAIEPRRCSWMLGLPFMFIELLDRQRRQARNVDTLRFCLSAGDVCPIGVQREFAALFGAPLRSVWASTEATGSLIHGLEPGPVSRITPGADIRIVDDNGAPVPRGEVGELLVRGPNVTVGYWVAEGRIDPATADGWFHTGDLMRRGKADDLWFVGRKKDLIIRGGSNISPVEVERVLMAHPGVRNAVVVGVPDATLGQRVAALVQLREKPRDAVLRDILASTRAQLADYKMPERLKVVDEIPRNILGKIDRRSAVSILLDDEADEAVAAE